MKNNFTRVLVMGQNPARSSVTGAPFLGTESGKRLSMWLSKAGVNFYMLNNVSNDKTENNRSLKRSEMTKIAKSKEFRERVEAYEKILAIGRQAEFTLELAKLHHKLPHIQIMYVPHPSGLNRALNDPNSEKQVVEMIKTFVNGGIKV